jgi:hypothetical protein
LGPVVAALARLERVGAPFPVRSEQILRLQEDKAFAWDEAARDFGFSPRTFEEGIAAEIAAITAPRPVSTE